jgi:methylase of polypeptide subunit release factors
VHVAAGKAHEFALEAAGSRKRQGAYYTPSCLVNHLLDALLEPLLHRAVLSLRICDPACGAGHFLVPAAERLATRHARDSGLPWPLAARQVIETCLFGYDIDSVALALCQNALSDMAEAQVAPNLYQADSLMLQERGRYDLVIGNPPFVNAIEHPGINQAYRHLYPALGGTADQSFYFLALAERLRKPHGFVGMVMPTTVLNAPAAARLREKAHLRYLHNASDHDLFAGAQVFVSLVGLGPPGPCVFNSRELDCQGENWWRAVSGGVEAKGARLGDHFEVSAGMTVAEAYACVPFLREWSQKGETKVLTTGLIDPGISLWGERRCRFLGKTYFRPVIAGAQGLEKRLDRARRPKVIVAGLSKQIECLFDPWGEYLPVVSTFVITHPKDQHDALAKLEVDLHEAAQQFQAELGANAMGGGSITMKKAFLQNLRLNL